MDVVISRFFKTAEDLEVALQTAAKAPEYVQAAQQSAGDAAASATQAASTAAQIVTEEDARQLAEASRMSAEDNRENAEAERRADELTRMNAERVRTAAESVRETAESGRVAAETLREDAETERRATFGSVLDQAAAAKEAAKASETAAAESAAAAKASETTVTESAAAAETARTGAEAAQVAAEAAKTGAQASQEAAAGSAATAKTEADRAKTEADRAAEIATGDFIPTAQKGAANGVATLDSDGKVPADQLPPMNYDPAGAAQVVQGNLQTHIADKGNPHGVTAAQVGARPSTWVPSKDEIGLGSVDNTADSQKNVNYANSAGNASRLIGAGWNWSGQGGQPSWLWGGNDGQNMYVYNPANFSVNYANTAGNANAVGGRAAGTVLSEIDNLKTSVANGKAQIASAISDKGVSTGAGADFGTMANNIRAIQTGYLGGAFNRAWNYERVSVSTSVVFRIPASWSYYLIPDYYDGRNSSHAYITIYDISKGYGITLQCGQYVTSGGAVTLGNGTIEVPSMEGKVRINQTQIVAVDSSIYVPVWYA